MNLAEQGVDIVITLFGPQPFQEGHSQCLIVEVAFELQKVGFEGKGAAFDKGGVGAQTGGGHVASGLAENLYLGGVDARTRQQQPTGVDVCGGYAKLTTAPGTAHHRAVDVVGPSKQRGGPGQITGDERPPNFAAGGADSIDQDRLDDFDGKAEAFASRAERFEVALAPLAVAKIVADDDMLGTEGLVEDLFFEFSCREFCKTGVEGFNDRGRHAGLGEELLLASHRGKSRQRPVGGQVGRGMRFKRHCHRITIEASGGLERAGQQRLVAPMHAVKISNGDGGPNERPKECPMTLEDFHSAATLARIPGQNQLAWSGRKRVFLAVDALGTWFPVPGRRNFRHAPMQATRYWLPRASGLLSFLWFMLMAAPGFYWLDSAELSAAGVGLGSPHPSGFPLYMLLIKAASLAPIGELAFRVNLLSAVCGAFAVGGVARLILVLGREDWATVAGAAGGAGVLCFTLLFARQATIAEVYAPTAALIVLTLLLFERVASGGNASAGLSLAWVAGLGFAVHPEYRLLMGLPILALLSLRVYRGARWPLLAPLMAVFAACATYLYLPVRSATGRIVSLDWGHPDTFHTVWAHASGAEVRKAFDDRMMSTTHELVTSDVTTFAEQVLDHMGALAVLAGLVGLVLLLVERRTRWLGATLGVIVVFDFIYASWINPMGLIDWQNGVPLVLALSVCTGSAVGALARSSGTGAPFVGAVIALIMPLPPALSSISTLALVGDLPRDYGEEALLSAPPRAILLSQGDSLSAGASFMQSVEGARPDIAALVVPMLSDRERVAHILEISSRENSEFLSEGDLSLAGLWNRGRPIIWEPGPVGAPQGGELIHGPVVARLVPAGQGVPRAATCSAA